MKITAKLSLVICSLLIFSACQKDTDVVAPDEEPQYVDVKLNLGGELTFTDKPLGDGRVASNDEVTYYGVQVYTVTSGGSYKRYAYGLFDQLDSSTTISFIEGNTYVVAATAIKKGTGYGLYKYETNEGTYFNSPFSQYVKNSIFYDNSTFIDVFESFANVLTSLDSSNYYWYYRPELDRYVGKVETTISEESDLIDLELKRAVFGVKLKVKNLTYGKLVVNLQNAPKIAITAPDSASAQRIFSFDNLGSHYSWSSLADSELVYTTIYHEFDGDGDTLANAIYDNDILFNRNMLKEIVVTMSSDSTGGGGTGSSRFTISLEDTPMMQDSTLYINQ